MDLSRRKFGRHTNETQTNSSQYVPNISSALIHTYQELFNSMQMFFHNYNLFEKVNEFKLLFERFNQKCVSIIGVNKVDTIGENDFLVNQHARQQLLDTILSIIFFNLFGITNINFQNFIYYQFSQDLNCILKHIKEQLFENEFTLLLKNFCFIYIMDSIENIAKNVFIIKEDSFKKRLIDLIKSEFTSFRFKEKNDDSICYINDFLLLIVEIEILINQYLNSCIP